MEYKFPDLGEGVAEGEVKKWLVKPGDQIKKDQSIAEVETDKAVVEMPSPVSGRVRETRFPEGGLVKVGEVLAVIDEEGAAAPAEKESVSVVGELPEHEEAIISKGPAEKRAPAAPPVQATPAVRKLAKDLGVDLSAVKGTGPGGRVTEGDVKNSQKPAPEAKAPRVQPRFDIYGFVEREPLRGIRRTTASHMVEAKAHAALVTVTDKADVTELARLREKVKKYAEEAKGLKVTYLPFIMKAAIAALKKHPYLNSELDEERQEIVLKKYYNLGVAVAIEDGLIVPVVKLADQKDIFTLAKELKDLSAQATERKIDMADLRGGTFTITNYGSFGGEYATPIPNYPEVAILGVGRMTEQSLVIGGEVKVRKVIPLSLTFDHRVLDGAEAAQFMNELVMFLQNPELALLEP